MELCIVSFESYESSGLMVIINVNTRNINMQLFNKSNLHQFHNTEFQK